MRKLVLDEINWFVQPRRRYVILGHRGSGKTTLLNIIDGSRFPTKGWVERKGSISPGRGIIRAGANTLTPRQIASRLARLYHQSAGEIIAFIEPFAEIAKVMDYPVGSLPNAIRLRLSYALTFAIPFDLYLFDGGIGPRQDDFSVRCRHAFDLRCRDAGAIVVTSSPKIAGQFDGAGMVLHDGKLRLFGSIAEAIAVFNTLPRPKTTPGLVPERNDFSDDDEGELDFV